MRSSSHLPYSKVMFVQPIKEAVTGGNNTDILFENVVTDILDTRRAVTVHITSSRNSSLIEFIREKLLMKRIFMTLL